MPSTTPLPWLTESSAERFNVVRDTSLAKLVRDDMLALILKGVLEPGQRINEPDVAARLGVSRVPVREALRELDDAVQAMKDAAARHEVPRYYGENLAFTGPSSRRPAIGH